MKRFVIIVWAAAQLAGCATPARQSETLLRSPPEIVRVQSLSHVPFVEQQEGYCGPATLTMAMLAAGRDVSVDEIAPDVYTPGKKGSLQLDLVSATRRRGMMAVQIESMQDLLREVAIGHPVIVLQNLGVSWYPRWHYALVTGYDLDREEVILHSGPEAFKRERMRRFERAWGLGEYWGLVVLPPDRLAASAGELAHMKGAAGLEQAGRVHEAGRAYAKILERYPESLGALVGLGNIAFKKNQRLRAVQYLRKAAKIHPESIVARHNLAIAEESLKRN